MGAITGEGGGGGGSCFKWELGGYQKLPEFYT